jgi:hypothetical protein
LFLIIVAEKLVGELHGLYLNNNLKYKMLPECNFSDPDVIESLFIEIEVPNKINIIGGNIYRPQTKTFVICVTN